MQSGTDKVLEKRRRIAWDVWLTKCPNNTENYFRNLKHKVNLIKYNLIADEISVRYMGHGLKPSLKRTLIFKWHYYMSIFNSWLNKR